MCRISLKFLTILFCVFCSIPFIKSDDLTVDENDSLDIPDTTGENLLPVVGELLMTFYNQSIL